jgi:hypothetical protein
VKENARPDKRENLQAYQSYSGRHLTSEFLAQAQQISHKTQQ